jgi:pimeloyl-ACP methyl ester carboxylesterase
MTETVKLEIAGATIPVHSDGEGPPVLFIHGALVDHRLWDPVVERLDGVRAIRPDLPLGSHTNACKPDADLSPPGLARMIAGVMEKLDLHDVTIVGNDTGGALTQITAAAHPERIGRVVLTNCDAYEEFLPKAFKGLQLLPYIPGALSATGALLKVDALRRSPLGYGLLTERPIPGELLDAWLAPIGVDAGVRRDTSKLLKGINKRYTLAAAEKLRSFDKPVLIVWGKNDKAFKPRLAERLAADIPGARLEWVDDSKTFVSLDQPERLAELIGGFVREPVRAAG